MVKKIQKHTVFKNKYFIVFFLTLIVLEKLAVFHLYPKAWSLVESADEIFLISIVGVAVLFFFATPKEMYCGIFLNSQNPLTIG